MRSPGTVPTLEQHRRYLRALRRPMRVAVLCEYSGRCRDELIRHGHDAISCDILPTDQPGPHVQGDAIAFARDHAPQGGWDLVLAFPPCTYLAASGGGTWRCNAKHDPLGLRSAKREASLRFVQDILNLPTSRLLIENPRGILSSRFQYDSIRETYDILPHPGTPGSMPASQMVNPFDHGTPESKQTFFWSRGVPLIEPTQPLDIQTHGWFYDGRNGGKAQWRWPNQTGRTGAPKMGPSKDRGHVKSLTYAGIARALGYVLGTGQHYSPTA